MLAKDIFLLAIEIESTAERSAFVAEKCEGDSKLRRIVDALLAAHNDPDSYLERPAARFGISVTSDGPNRDPSVADSTSHHGRFLPGTKIAGRYRIVSMLGRGGMGEVYRADDLRLGQTVALKFLPPELAKDAKRREYFDNEVRLARQISHPNVCRVYDIGEVDGQHFISMEYIDGEDLKVLLHRIGRVPVDKGVQIAQQLCAGLAAAHAKGVLHRDLKPANIMIDGQGQVRITDFGLATGSANDGNIVGMSGTPAYMAPEQLLRGQTSIQSDVYALGLILHEVFTGKSIHSASSIADLRRFHEETSQPTSGTNWPSDMDPAVDRAIRRCLEPDPADRPMSVSLLAASLPGGDPLAAALAAGETPSPELVAASGGTGTLSPQIVASCLAMIVALLGGVFYFSGMTHLVNLTLLEKPPEYLRERAKEIIQHLGYDQPPMDSAAGFRGDDFEFRYVVNSVSGKSAKRRLTMFRDSPWHAVQYWYRQSPKPLVSHEYRIRDRDSVRTRVEETTPPWTTSGMVGVRLDTAGYLRRFQAVPAKQLFAKPATSNPTWSMWFPESITSFDLTQLENADGEWITTPSTPFDALAAWEGKWPNSEEPLKVVAAAYRGRPVFFDVISPGAANPKLLSERYRGSEVLSLVLFGVVSVAAILTSFFHLRTGRGDKEGAVRIGIAVFTLELIAWMFNASHVTGQAEISLIQTAMGMASFRGGVAGLIYLAVEPLVRRDWPELLVSSTRLLRGRWSDPRIGRDLMFGTLVGIINYYFAWVIVAHFDVTIVVIGYFQVLSDSLCFVSELSGFCIHLVTAGLSILFAMWFVHRLTRNKVATVALLIGLGTAMIFTQVGMEPWELPVLILSTTLATGVLFKYGILAWAWQNLVWSVLQMPITTNTEAFYFDQGVVAVGCVLAAASYGAYTSIRRDRTVIRPLP